MWLVLLNVDDLKVLT